MSDVWWYMSRSSGVVATVLIVAALLCGLFFKARATGARRRPNWWLDLHNYLGGLALLFTVVHVFAVYQDEFSGIGLVQVLVPFTAAGSRWGITFGVVATSVFAMVVFTSWPKRRGSRNTWLLLHLVSIPATLFAGIHAWMVGSSRGELWFQVLLVALVGVVTYPAVLRLFAVADRRNRMATRRPTEPAARARREREPVSAGGG